MDDADFDRTMARVLQVSPVEMTFEDGMRIVEYLTSFVVMFRQAENEQAIPDPDKLAKFDADTEGLIEVRSDLVELWRRMVQEHQPGIARVPCVDVGQKSKGLARANECR
jgi:hypothetical protein